MEFKLSDHAQKRIQQRKIRPEWIKAAIDNPDQLEGDVEDSALAHALNPNNPLEKTASYRRRPVSRWLIIPRESGTTSRYCPLRGVFFLLDSGLRRNDELMDYLG